MIDLSRQVFIAFDTETTGLSPQNSHVIEIAGVRFTGTGQEIARFCTLANPGVRIDPEVTKIHGIDDAMVASAPDPVHACQQFAHWIHEGDILIAYNAPFDVNFISSELVRGNEPAPTNRVIDFLRCARDLELPVDNYKLKTLVEYFELPATGYHRAMADSLHLMELFVRFLGEAPAAMRERLLQAADVPTHADMARAGSVSIPARFGALPEALDHGYVVEISYHDDDPNARNKGGTHRVLPINLCNLSGHDYLIAQSMSDGRVRHFRLDRIGSVWQASERRRIAYL